LHINSALLVPYKHRSTNPGQNEIYTADFDIFSEPGFRRCNRSDFTFFLDFNKNFEDLIDCEIMFEISILCETGKKCVQVLCYFFYFRSYNNYAVRQQKSGQRISLKRAYFRALKRMNAKAAR